MSEEDRGLMLMAIRENPDLMNSYKLTDQQKAENNNKGFSDYDKWEVDTDGSYVFKLQIKKGSGREKDKYKDMDTIFNKIQQGRVFELNKPGGGKQKVMFLGKGADKDGHITLIAVDVETGSQFTVKPGLRYYD